MCGVLWLVTRNWISRDFSKTSSVAVICVLALAAVLHAPPFAAVVCLFLALMAATWSIATNVAGERPAWSTTVPAAVIFAAVIGVLLVNYAMTGLMEATPFRLFWNMANQSVFSALVSPYLVLFLEEGTTPSTGKVGLIDALDPIRLGNLLHVQYLPDDVALAAGRLLGCLLILCLFDKKLRSLFLARLCPPQRSSRLQQRLRSWFVNPGRSIAFMFLRWFQ